MKIWIYRRIQIYKNLGITIPFFRRIPTDWYLMNTRQLTTMAQLLIQHKQPFDYTEHPYKLSFQFSLLNQIIRISPDEFYKFTDIQVSVLLQQINKLFTTRPDQIRIKPFKLPNHLLTEQSTFNFAIYEHHYRLILTGADEDRNHHLITFAGYLLSGTKELTEMRATQISGKLSKRKDGQLIAFLAYWWYYHQRVQLIERYPGAFGMGGKSRKGADFTSEHGWFGLIHNVAQDGPFGNEEDTRHTELHNFLHWLEYNANRMKEQEWNQRFATN